MGGESGSVWRRNEHGLVHQGGVGCIMSANQDVVYRVVEQESHTLPSEQMFYQLPLDMHQLSSEKEVSDFISNLKGLCVCGTNRRTH